MMAPKKNESLALLHTVDRESLLPQLITQINKDARLSGLDLELDQKSASTQIVDALAGQIRNLLQNHFNAYLNFLYRVDIPEARMLVHEEQSMDEVVAHATLQVLSREWEKVWFKNKTR